MAIDAAPERSGVATYWRDLLDTAPEALDGKIVQVGHAQRARASLWRRCLRVPMPGDPTQQLQIVDRRAIGAIGAEIGAEAVVVATPGPIGIAAVRAARDLAVPVIASIHTDLGAIAHSVFAPWAAPILASALRQVEDGFLRKAAAIAVPSARLGQALAPRLRGRRWRVVRTPLHPIFLLNPPEPPTAIQRVFYGGRFSQEKNVGAVVEIARAFPQLRVAMAGDGPDWGAVERAAPPNLELRRWLPRAELRKALDNADLVVLPSYADAFGTIALEAMARRRIVLVAAGCGIADSMQANGGGVILNADVGIVRTVRDLLHLNSLELRALASANWHFARQYAGAAVDDWRDLVAGVLDAQRC